MGIKEQIAFPEISIDKVNKITGMDITFVTDTNSDIEALTLLKEFGLPFKEDNSKKEERKEQLEKKELEERRELEEAAKQEISGADNEENNVESEDVLEEDSMNDQSISTELDNKDNNQDLSEETDKSGS